MRWLRRIGSGPPPDRTVRPCWRCTWPDPHRAWLAERAARCARAHAPDPLYAPCDHADAAPISWMRPRRVCRMPNAAAAPNTPTDQARAIQDSVACVRAMYPCFRRRSCARDRLRAAGAGHLARDNHECGRGIRAMARSSPHLRRWRPIAERRCERWPANAGCGNGASARAAAIARHASAAYTAAGRAPDAARPAPPGCRNLSRGGAGSTGPGGLQVLVGSAAYYFGLGDLLREWNDLDAAEHHLTQGMELVAGR